MEVDIRLRPCNIRQLEVETGSRIEVEIGSRIQDLGCSEDLAGARWRFPYLSWAIHHPCHKHCDVVGHKYTFTTMARPMATIFEAKRSFSFKDLDTIQCGKVRKGNCFSSPAQLDVYLSPLTFLSPDYVRDKVKCYFSISKTNRGSTVQVCLRNLLVC